MKTLSAQQVEDKILSIYNGLRNNLWMFGNTFEEPNRQLFDEIHASVMLKLRRMQFVTHKAECELFAAKYATTFKEYWAQRSDTQYSVPLAEVTGVRIEMSKDRIHTCNMILMDDDLWLIEPQTGQIVKIDKPIKDGETNFIFFAKM